MDHVLGNFEEEEMSRIPLVIERVCDVGDVRPTTSSDMRQVVDEWVCGSDFSRVQNLCGVLSSKPLGEEGKGVAGKAAAKQEQGEMTERVKAMV